jgi:HEAT repeat protein
MPRRSCDPRTGVRLCPRTAQATALLISLLEDLNPGVTAAAAKALGRMGRAEARPWRVRLLRQNLDAELIEAVTLVADEECEVLLGRIARQHPALRDAALSALEAIETRVRRLSWLRSATRARRGPEPKSLLPAPAER